MGIHVAPGFAAIDDFPLLWPVHTVDHIQHRTFAGTIGADDGADFVLPHVEGNLGQRTHAAE